MLKWLINQQHFLQYGHVTSRRITPINTKFTINCISIIYCYNIDINRFTSRLPMFTIRYTFNEISLGLKSCYILSFQCIKTVNHLKKRWSINILHNIISLKYFKCISLALPHMNSMTPSTHTHVQSQYKDTWEGSEDPGEGDLLPRSVSKLHERTNRNYSQRRARVRPAAVVQQEEHFIFL